MSDKQACKRQTGDKLSADLEVALAHWIASSDDGLRTVLRTALQNQAYNLASRRTIDTVIVEMYKEKLAEPKKI